MKFNSVYEDSSVISHIYFATMELNFIPGLIILLTFRCSAAFIILICFILGLLIDFFVLSLIEFLLSAGGALC